MKKLNKDYLIVALVLALALLCAGGIIHALIVPAEVTPLAWRFW